MFSRIMVVLHVLYGLVGTFKKPKQIVEKVSALDKNSLAVLLYRSAFNIHMCILHILKIVICKQFINHIILDFFLLYQTLCNK